MTFESMQRQREKKNSKLCEHRNKKFALTDSRFYDDSNRCQKKKKRGNVFCEEHL